MLRAQLEAHLKMRASLEAIRDLDPDGVSARLAELDAEIAGLRKALGIRDGAPLPKTRMEIISIGQSVRAA